MAPRCEPLTEASLVEALLERPGEGMVVAVSTPVLEMIAARILGSRDAVVYDPWMNDGEWELRDGAA